MKIELLNKDYAEISFANQAKVSIKTQEGHESSIKYKVRWSRRRKCADSYEQVGIMDIESGTWGAYPYEEIEQWKIDFDAEGTTLCFDNTLNNKPVILIAKTKTNKVGKSIDFDKIKEYCTSKVNEFNCDLKVYFKDSSKFDFTDVNFEPLRMNDEIPDMFFGLEKEF